MKKLDRIMATLTILAAVMNITEALMTPGIDIYNVIGTLIGSVLAFYVPVRLIMTSK